MATENDIAQLQAQIQELQQQLQQQQQQIQALQQQVNISPLPGKPTPATKARYKTPHAAPSPNLDLENYIGLKLIHVAGIVVLVIGLSLGVKYAIDQQLISIWGRIGLAYLAGGILFGLSVWLKKNYHLFSAILFSGAMATFYITTFATCNYYNLLQEGAAFAIMLVITVYTTWMAISYNRQQIALLGMVGAYAIPFLVSHDKEGGFLFLSYILLINTGIAFLSFKKSWRTTNGIAIAFSWLIFAVWIASYNLVFHQAIYMTIAFALCYYLLFTISLMTFPVAEQDKAHQTKLLLLLLNNTVFYLVAQHINHMIEGDLNVNPRYPGHPEKTAYVSAAFAIAYTCMAWGFQQLKRQPETLSKYMFIQSIVLTTLFIVQYWDGVIVTLLWLLLAILLFIAGVRVKASWPRLSAMALLAFTLCKLIIIDSQRFTPLQKTLCYILLGCVLLLVAFFYQKFKQVLFVEEKENNDSSTSLP
ncbi:Predicted membrane protein [Filimonas lacunae]|uniref:Predicted membrane protein n=1 Tax=Filimonas lacunae TaxID=477680 RepID=A0A173MNQ5_9BACT|nr:DUF2339 domain-containing protein [Filimonas lacunae]BAV09080.1 hypothetical protein FLA_5128 [Filimonas lacunae]SIS67015.1 Predicted membrane protein [Filimonas lacunae]